MAGKKNRNAVPTGNTKASGTRAPAGTIDVFSVANDGTKTYLGWATDKNKLAFFSRAGDRALNPDKFTKYGAMNPKPNWQPDPTKRALQVHELLLGPNVDKLAAEIVIKWINENSITDPKAFSLAHTLFGEDSIPFKTALNVHYAMATFDLQREHSGSVIRNAIFKYINQRDDPLLPNADDFKYGMEKIDFDDGLLSVFMTQIMWRSVNKTIDSAVLDEIKVYCQEKGLYEDMKAIGEGVVAKKMSYRKGKKAGKPIEHGW